MPNELREITPEAEQVARAVRAWLNGYEDKPARMVDVDNLGEGTGLALETIQAAYKTRQYIIGGYQAQYQFAILYRTIPATANERLQADEVLNNYALWAEMNPLALNAPCAFRRVYRNTNASLLARDDTGAEIHQILMTLEYEVNV